MKLPIVPSLYAAIGVILCADLCVADTLTTAHYVVTVTRHCQEGEVRCDNVSYHGASKKTGKAMTLKGSTLHTLCADGVTPCGFLGYQFKTGNFRYLVLESGTLRVVKGDSEVLIDELGEWTY